MNVPKAVPTPGTVRGPELVRLALPPSCIEFCPSHPDYILVGTYNLQEGGEDYTGTGNMPAGEQGTQESAEAKQELDDDPESMPAKREQSRNGSLILFRCQDDQLKHVQTLPTPSAILDLHFHPGSEFGHHFGAVSSTGTFIMGRIELAEDHERHETSIKIIAYSIIPEVGQDVIFTSFAWLPDMANGAAITTTTGQVWVVVLDSTSRIRAAQQLPLTSKMENWCVAVSPLMDKNGACMVYSGGDDGILRYTSVKMLPQTKFPTQDEMPLPSIKSGESEEARDTPLWEQSFSPGPHIIADCLAAQQLIKSEHTSGVTAILPLPPCQRGLELIITGSYDDHIRVFLMKNMEEHVWAPHKIFEESLGGGVWKLHIIKWRVGNPKGPNGNIRSVYADILASCMHGGPKILRFGVFGVSVKMEVVHEFEGHELNYASHFRTRGNEGVDFVTTSFYDKKLNWWTWEPSSS